MTISAIVAVAKNGVIGKDNQIPWYIPADLKYFMRTTTGHHMLMGRKCFESLGKPLKNRPHLVVTRNPYYLANGAIIFNSISEALEFAKSRGEEECFVIGGGVIYDITSHLWDKLYLTEIDLEPEGDVYFPEIAMDQWKLDWEEHHEPDAKNPAAYTFKRYSRIS